MTRSDLLPATRSGLVLAFCVFVLSAIWLLGEQRARLAAFVFPSLDALWLAGILAGVALLTPRAPVPARVSRMVGLAAVLVMLAWPVRAFREATIRSDTFLTASYFRDASGPTQIEGVAAIDLMNAKRRLALRRLTGRNRDVGLSISGYLRVSEDGDHFFELESDGVASLSIGGETVAAGPHRLERGLHPIVIRYRRGGGPAFLDLMWDRPAFFEPLPIAYFADALPGRIDPATIRRAEVGSLVSLALTLAWCGLLSCFVVRLGESFRVWNALRRPGALVFASAILFLIALLATLQPRDEEDPFYARTSSEFMMQTVSIADLRDQPLRSIWYLHIQPPLFDAIRTVLAQTLSTSDDSELLRRVDLGLRILCALLYGALVALLYRWLRRTIGPKLALLGCLAFALHPALILYATWLDSTLLGATGITWFYYELWKAHGGRGSTARLVGSTILLFFTRSIFQWPFLLVVALSLALMGFPRRRLATFVALAGTIMGLYVVKQYWLFGMTYTSSFAGYNGCRSIGADVGWNTPERLPPLPAPSAASVLAREKKVNGEYNFNQLHYLEISFALMERYRNTLRSQPLGKTLAAYRQNLEIYLLPSSRYEQSPIVDSLAWRELYDVVSSRSVLLILVLISTAAWLVRASGSMGKGLALAFPAAYIALVSIVFESGENMRFRFFLEPVLFVFVSTELSAVGRRRSAG